MQVITRFMLVLSLLISVASFAENGSEKDADKKVKRNVAGNAWDSDQELDVKSLNSFTNGPFTRVIDKKTGLVCYITNSAMSCQPYNGAR